MTAYIDARRDRFGVEPICRVLSLNPSTYHARRKRPPSQRTLRDAWLLERIRSAHATNHGVYGHRKSVADAAA